jgi:hypothetical protein
MTAPSRRAYGRWAAVVSGCVLLGALPALIGALPVPDSPVSATALKARILASAGVPYQGYAESTVDLGLPRLPSLGEVSTLLDGTTDQYVWYCSAGRWRADGLSTAGEDDVYQTPSGSYRWNYTTNLFTNVIGSSPVRLPQAADLLPPFLARRLTGFVSAADRLSRLPSQRIAGLDAAGLRIAVRDPGSTVAAVQVWADPRTGLPVRVEIFGRGTGKPLLVSGFLQVSEHPPAAATVTPHPAPGVGTATVVLPDLPGILNGFGPQLPPRLAGLPRIAVPENLTSVAAYGTGFSRFAVVPLPGRTGAGAMRAALAAGAASTSLGTGTGVVVGTPLLTVVLAVSGYSGPVYLLAGTVTPARLERAAAAVLARQATAP